MNAAVIAVVVHVNQAMVCHVGLDGTSGLIQPGANPAQTVTPGLSGHCRQPGRAAAAQRLKQHCFGLIPSMMGQQNQGGPDLTGHIRQRRVTRTPRGGLDAAPIVHAHHAARQGTHGQAAIGPAPAAIVHMGLPGVGLQAEPMVDMKRNDRQTRHIPCGAGGRMKQRDGVSPPAARHGHDGHGVIGLGVQRSLVSVKRP